MSEYERARKLLDKHFAELNDRLEKPHPGQGEGKFTLSAYIKSITEINQAVEQIKALEQGRATNGIRRRTTKGRGDSAASASGDV